ncbi:MAG: ATP-binding protein [Lachnospiraceae bacterium]|nr:ATP-binding protein [Lachnospiraceae bacterium]
MSEQVLNIAATIDNLTKVLEVLDGFLEANDCNMKAQIQLDVAVEEIYVNIAHYAYGVEGGGDAELHFETDEINGKKAVKITFIDSGVYYDPLAKEDPDITLSASERPVGGLGIFMVKKSMDDIVYERKDDKNILVIKKVI